MKGARANSTAYSARDVVEVTFGSISYRLQCRIAGTSGGSAPSAPTFYNVDIPDGTVQWRLVGATAFRGVLFDSLTYYNWLHQCDITGPYNVGISFEDTASSGSLPQTNWVSQCTIHGPITVGVSLNNGARNNHILDCDILPLGDVSASGATAIFLGTGQSNYVRGCDAYDFETGVLCAGSWCDISHNSMTGGTRGVDLTGVAAQNRVIGNNVATRTVGGANTTGVRLQAGASRNIVSLNSAFGAGTPISDLSGGGTNNIIANNMVL